MCQLNLKQPENYKSEQRLFLNNIFSNDQFLIMRTIICLSMLLLIATLTLAQKNKQISVAFVSTGTGYPFSKFGKLITNARHPGVEIGYSFNWKTKSKHDWYQEFKLAYFYHRFVQHGIPLYTDIGYRYRILERLTAQVALGAGYMHSIPATAKLKLAANGEYENDKGIGRMQALAAVNFGIGYTSHSSAKTPLKIGLPGISLLVNDAKGTWVGSIGKADIERNIPFQTGQVSKIASITKLFVGTLVFKLIEDSVNTGLNYNALNTKIDQWLPSSITSKLPNGNEITLGQCMKHETGVPDVIEQDAFYLAVLNNPNKTWKPEELLKFIYDKQPDFNAGDTAIYSNTNTTLVIMIIEAATGKKHSDLLKQYVLNLLKLSNTFYQPHDDLPNTVAQGYFDLYNNNTIVNVSNLVTGSGNGYGGIYSNIFDLSTFIDALLLKKNLLSTKSLGIMQTYGKPDGINEYGYGLMKKFISRGIDAGYGHSGRDLGYTANVFYFPNKSVTHAFLVNYGTDAKSNLREIFNQFQEELLNLTLQ